MCMCIHMSINTNSSAIKKNAMLPFVTIWIDFEGIMLSEISQTNTIMISVVESKTKLNSQVENRLVVAIGGG